MVITFTCDCNAPSEPLPHVWEQTVGSSHAPLALRADWQAQLTKCHAELGFKYVRFHGLLSDDMGTLLCENEELVYSFFNIDQVFDFLLSIGMKPFVELSFMPSTLSSGSDTVFKYQGNITPPKDYSQWSALIDKLVSHWVERYGLDEVSQWYFEVWNEPNLTAFWTGTQQDYFTMYKHTADAIKKIDPSLKVGGPATANNAWIEAFLKFSESENITPDFISTHHYPTDAFGKPGDNTREQLAKSKRSVLRDQAAAVKKQTGDLPVIYTEWNTSSNPFDEMHDEPYAAAFIIKTIMEARLLVEGYSFWTFTDIFEENYLSSVPFHGGFGLLTIHGIPKPTYRSYELLHGLGDRLLQVDGTHDTVDIWITTSAKNMKVLITNGALPTHPIETEHIKLQLKNIPALQNVFIERIDADNANAYGAWIAMGKPASLSARDVKELEAHSALQREPHPIKVEGKNAFVEVTVSAQSATCITFELI